MLELRRALILGEKTIRVISAPQGVASSLAFLKTLSTFGECHQKITVPWYFHHLQLWAILALS